MDHWNLDSDVTASFLRVYDNKRTVGDFPGTWFLRAWFRDVDVKRSLSANYPSYHPLPPRINPTVRCHCLGRFKERQLNSTERIFLFSSELRVNESSFPFTNNS